MSAFDRRVLGAPRSPVRRLLLVFGDQLDAGAPVLDELDPERDAVLMMEVADEATHVPSHRQRTALFLAAMRHHALALRRRGLAVRYVTLDDEDNTGSFDGEVRRAVDDLAPEALLVVRPGEWRVQAMVDAWERDLDVRVERREDAHFLIEPDDFAAWAEGRRELVLEHFQRMMRRRFGVLVDGDGEPAGGAWNFDASNREPYRGDVDDIPPPKRFRPDAITRAVLDLVDRRFPDAPGTTGRFGWPVTRRAALAQLRQFIDERLPRFGPYQDAMRSGQPWMFHSLLSAPLNLHLLHPRECIAAAVRAWRDGAAPIESVEGFVRQILGWREFIRGVYWSQGPDYAARNALDSTGALPSCYWDGATDLACVRAAVGQVLEHGYGHHIQRLMVTGNLALTAGADPKAVSDWYLGMFVDGVDWVTLPNALGMVMHADGGVVGTKPYCASGKYVQRMSDHCAGCRYDPARRHGDGACPFTVLYWDFLSRTRPRLRGNPRMAIAHRNLDRLDDAERRAIRASARRVRVALGVEPESDA